MIENKIQYIKNRAEGRHAVNMFAFSEDFISSAKFRQDLNDFTQIPRICLSGTGSVYRSGKT